MPQSSGPALTISDAGVDTGNVGNALVQQNASNFINFWVNFNCGPGFENFFGGACRFDMNFQIIRAGDLSVVSNNWLSQGNWTDKDGVTHGPGYPIIVDYLIDGIGPQSFGYQAQASFLNIQGGDAQNAESNKTGLYILRIYMFVDSAIYEGNTPFPQGTSAWAVSDDTFFWCET
jgi:hypothetical protein